MTPRRQGWRRDDQLLPRDRPAVQDRPTGPEVEWLSEPRRTLAGEQHLPPHRFGHTPTTYTRVIPDLVVELSVDLAAEGLRWRHPARFLRLRTELTAVDLGAES
jgi:hypothetical protein